VQVHADDAVPGLVAHLLGHVEVRLYAFAAHHLHDARFGALSPCLEVLAGPQRDARVVHEHVEGAATALDLVEHRGDLPAVRDVGGDREGAARVRAHLLDGLFGGSEMEVVHHHPRPFLGEEQRDRPTDPRSPARHQRHPILELHRVLLAWGLNARRGRRMPPPPVAFVATAGATRRRRPLSSGGPCARPRQPRPCRPSPPWVPSRPWRPSSASRAAPRGDPRAPGPPWGRGRRGGCPRGGYGCSRRSGPRSGRRWCRRASSPPSRPAPCSAPAAWRGGPRAWRGSPSDRRAPAPPWPWPRWS